LPTLWIISVIAFFMSKNTPQDPVVSILSLRGLDDNYEEGGVYASVYKEMGYAKPTFYFSILPHYYPADINTYASAGERRLVKTLARNGYHKRDINGWIKLYRSRKADLRNRGERQEIIKLEQSLNDPDLFLEILLAGAEKPKSLNFFYPVLKWHGFDNQYHNWFISAMKGDFGQSILDGQAASAKVGKALQWTLSFTLVDYIVSIAAGLSLALFLARNPRGRLRNGIRQVLYFFYALPLFWLATILVVYFTTDDYGSWTKIFPSVGMQIFPGRSTLTQIWFNADRLILPVLCLGLHSLAYVTRMIENALHDEMHKDYVLMAFSRGLSRKHILRSEVLRNALIPSITLFMSAFAAAFSGSLVLEVIFNIPGMGRLLYNSIGSGDWNVVFCVLMVVSLVTVLAYLIADILYVRFNPRIKFD